MHTHVRRLRVVVFLCVVAGGSAAAQTPAPADPAAAVLGRAWTAIAAGRTSEAAAAADELLRTNPHDRRAVTVKIEALAVAAPLQALDVYEQWITIASSEDVFLLEPVARGTLEGIASGPDARLRLDALEALTRAGIGSARQRLSEERGVAAALALARLGDGSAVARFKGADLEQQRPEVRIEILALGGATAFESLRPFLSERSGAVRAKAVEAIGRVGGAAAVEVLRTAAADPEFHVRATAQVALAKLGDPSATSVVEEMLTSPVPDVRLMAAGAFAPRGPGPWVEAILPLLDNNEGLIKLQAAELLAPVNPEAARAVLLAAAGDANPVVRGEAARVLASPGVARPTGGDLAALRRALRDGDAAVRLHAASAILGAFARK